MVSETFRPVTPSLDVSGSYTDIVLLREGVNMRLYRASKAGKYFAIKTTKDNLALQLAMLKREYELSIALDHYHLPHFYTFEPNSPVGPGIVMEYVDGRNLNEFLAENPSHDTCCRVFAQLLEVVAFIHKNGIIHNDLKPENILITKANDDVKLLDFGLSNTDAHYLTKTMGCTRAYASPELLAQSEDIDVRSDIYSLGKLMQLIFPRKYRSFRRKCLNENRDKRWDNVDQMRRQWNKSNAWIYYMLGTTIAIAIVAFILWNRGVISEAQRQELLDSLSVARNEARVTQQQFDSIKIVQQNAEAAQQRWEVMKDSSVNEMNRQIEACYLVTLDSIKRAPFKEFAYQVMSNYTIRIINIQNKCIASAPDEIIESIILSTYTKTAMERFNALDKMAKEKPSMYDKIDELGIKKVEYYNSLLQKGLPFREYKE